MEKLPADILTLEPVAVQTGAGVVVEAGVVRRAAGASLVHAATRPHAARERVRGELLAEAAGGPVVTGSDTFGAVLLAEIAAGAAAADDDGHDD